MDFSELPKSNKPNEVSSKAEKLAYDNLYPKHIRNFDKLFATTNRFQKEFDKFNSIGKAFESVSDKVFKKFPKNHLEIQGITSDKVLKSNDALKGIISKTTIFESKVQTLSKGLLKFNGLKITSFKTKIEELIEKLDPLKFEEYIKQLELEESNDNIVELSDDVIPKLTESINNLYESDLNEDEKEDASNNLMGFIEALIFANNDAQASLS